MSKEEYIDILDNLADGINPLTGEKLPSDSFLKDGKIIRSLQFAIDSIYENINYVSKNDTEIFLPSDKSYWAKKEGLLEILKDLKNIKLNPSPNIITKILLGYDSQNFDEKLKSLKYYSLLNGLIRFNKLQKLISNFFIENKEEVEKFQLSEEEKSPWMTFDLSTTPTFNKLKPEYLERLKQKAKLIPIIKSNESLENNKHALELRKQYRRSFDPISNEETELFNKALEYTNDVNLLMEVFERNKNSVISRMKKYYYMKGKT